MTEQTHKTPRQVAEQMHVPVRDVRAWIANGSLQAFDLSSPNAARKRWRITQEAIDEFLKLRTSNQASDKPQRSRRNVQRPVHDFFAGIK